MAGQKQFPPVPPEVAERPTVPLPRGRPRPPARRRAPVLLAATVGALWAAILSYLPVLAVVWLAAAVAAGAPAASIFRVGTGAWLLGNGVPLQTSAGEYGLIPLSLTALVAWRVARAGVHTTRAIGGRRSSSFRLAGLATLAVALVYGLLGTGVAALVNRPGFGVSPLRAGLTFAGFAVLAAGFGALAESGLAHRAALDMPQVLRHGIRTGLVAALLVLGVGAAVAGISVALSGGEAGAMLASYHIGVTGQAGLTLLCLLYGPNLSAWSAAYLIGPGFAFGTGTTVSAARVSLGALPAVPALAGLPSTAVSGVGGLLLGVPMAGGMAAGWLLARRLVREARNGSGKPLRGRAEAAAISAQWRSALGSAALSGPVAGILLGLVAQLSGGPLGSGRLSVVGPHGLPVALVGAAVVSVGAMLAAAATLILIGARSR